MLVFHRAFFNHYPRSTPPITVATSANAQALRLSACLNGTTSKIAPPIIFRHSFPPQLSSRSDSYVAPGDHPFGLRGDGGGGLVKQGSKGPSSPARLTDNWRMGETCRAAWSSRFCTVLFESEN